MHNHIDHTRYVTRYLPVRSRILTPTGECALVAVAIVGIGLVSRCVSML